MKVAPLRSKGGRLFVNPIDILLSEKGQEIMNSIRKSKTYKSMKKAKANWYSKLFLLFVSNIFALFDCVFYL